MEVMHVLPGTVSKGVELLNEGHLLAISPGTYWRVSYLYTHFLLL